MPRKPRATAPTPDAEQDPTTSPDDGAVVDVAPPAMAETPIDVPVAPIVPPHVHVAKDEPLAYPVK